MLDTILYLSAIVSSFGMAMNDNNFETFTNMLNQNDQSHIASESIDTFSELASTISDAIENMPFNYYEAIGDLSNHFEEEYPDYRWIQSSSVSTEDVSKGRVTSVPGNIFPISDLQQAIEEANIISNYGGCGPVAGIGVLDYFARYLGYDEIMENPQFSVDRINLSVELLQTMNTMELPGGYTYTSPGNFSSGMNTFFKEHGLENKIIATDRLSLLGNARGEYLPLVMETINDGLPVTLGTGAFEKKGDFAGHYANIFGYEQWNGIHKETGERLEKTFFRCYLNNNSGPCYCDSEILNYVLVTIITYETKYDNSFSFVADDFDSFVNENGGGQYFFDEKNQTITTSDGKSISTNRLRCSYIENEYLVLSPKRDGAGQAYLHLIFDKPIQQLEFDVTTWSSHEDSANETFIIQYKRGFYDGFYNQVEINPQFMLNDKDRMEYYKVRFPSNVYSIRFYAEHDNPEGDRNKGRIVLDNIIASYNVKGEVI